MMRSTRAATTSAARASWATSMRVWPASKRRASTPNNKSTTRCCPRFVPRSAPTGFQCSWPKALHGPKTERSEKPSRSQRFPTPTREADGSDRTPVVSRSLRQEPLTIRYARLEGGSDAVEQPAEVRTERRDRRKRYEGNQGDEQSILDHGGTFVVAQVGRESLEHSLFS